MANKAPVAGQKIKRKFMAHFIDSALPGAGEPHMSGWVPIWKSLM